MVNEEISWTASLCRDEDDKCIISKLNIYRQNSRKGRGRTAAQSMTLRNGQSRVADAPLTQPLGATMQLCLLLMVQFSPLPSLQALTPESLHLSLTSQTGAISPRTETIWPLEVKHTCGWAASFLEGVEGLNHICLWVRCCENSCPTRGQTGAPKGLVQSWSLWYSASIW